MSAILEQLGLDQSFFVHLAIFAALFFVLSRVYFRPFQRLIDARHKRTVEDREAAEKMMQQAQARLEEYKTRLAEERSAARREYEQMIEQAKKEESAILSGAREEAKRITQEAAESVNKQREQLKRQLELDVEVLSRNISEKLLSRKV